MSLAPCPVGRLTHPVHDLPDEPPCGTMLQPYRGRLIDGVAQHLMVVHQLAPEEWARGVATRWVEAGCRAKG